MDEQREGDLIVGAHSQTKKRADFQSFAIN